MIEGDTGRSFRMPVRLAIYIRYATLCCTQPLHYQVSSSFPCSLVADRCVSILWATTVDCHSQHCSLQTMVDRRSSLYVSVL